MRRLSLSVLCVNLDVRAINLRISLTFKSQFAPLAHLLVLLCLNQFAAGMEVPSGLSDSIVARESEALTAANLLMKGNTDAHASNADSPEKSAQAGSSLRSRKFCSTWHECYRRVLSFVKKLAFGAEDTFLSNIPRKSSSSSRSKGW